MPLTVHATRTLAGRGGGRDRRDWPDNTATVMCTARASQWSHELEIGGKVSRTRDGSDRRLLSVEAHSRRYLIFTLKLN